MRFDLLIKGGEIVDPGTGYFGVGDVAVQRDRVAAVERQIPAESAFRTIDASGLLVTPGLIDMHTELAITGSTLTLLAQPPVSRAG
jgi:dihydroorotase